MASVAAETDQPAAVAVNNPDDQQNDEEHATEHMQGSALASLSLAFMSVCFVLALDNTILGLCFSLNPANLQI